jgi:hypothetical protein
LAEGYVQVTRGQPVDVWIMTESYYCPEQSWIVSCPPKRAVAYRVGAGARAAGNQDDPLAGPFYVSEQRCEEDAVRFRAARPSQDEIVKKIDADILRRAYLQRATDHQEYLALWQIMGTWLRPHFTCERYTLAVPSEIRNIDDDIQKDYEQLGPFRSFIWWWRGL